MMDNCAINSLTRVKKAEIFDALKQDIDINWLKEFCITTHGLVDNEVRKRVWPILSGKSTNEAFKIVEYDEETLRKHPSHHQVELDVNRTRSLMPPEANEEEVEELKIQLKRLIVSLLIDNPELHYYQGFNDICCIFLSVLGESDARHLLNNIMPSRFAIFMETTLDSTVEYMQLIYALLGHLRPRLTQRLDMIGVGPNFALAWILTWFAHVLPDLADIRRLFDLFLATQPVMLIYLSVAVIIRSDEEVASTSDDFALLHSTLLRLPKRHRVEDLVRYSVQLYTNVPPDQLTSLGNQRRLYLSTSAAESQKERGRLRMVPWGAIISALVLVAAVLWYRWPGVLRCTSFLGLSSQRVTDS